ncbi:MAG TPA: FAD-dependent oxidoreductase [Steroidobacter sp.]|nr:FAD-dependent oxidoreductase [Steroidobacter sp.]
MTTYETVLAGREEIAASTMAFHFRKPAGFSFRPGQAIDLILDSRALEAQSGRHTFSLVSAPSEPELTIATRMRDSAFKRTLKTLPIGEHVRLEGPSGSLMLHNNRSRPAIFIAGGIGVTPFMSILRQAAADKLQHQLVLLYSNRRPEDAAFLAELEQLERENAHFRLMATMTQANPSDRPWHGASGQIDKTLLRGIAEEWPAPIWYVAGPPTMVEAMRRVLNDAGVDGDDVRSEDFYGY